MDSLKRLFKKKSFIAILIIVIAGGGYFAYKTITTKATPTRYVTAAAEKGTLIVSVSGSGQISTSNQVDIKPKVSANIIAVPVSAGQSVKTGDTIARLDASDALKTVRDAQINLDSAKLALQKLQQPTDSLSLLQAQNALAQANQTKANAEDSLKKAYDSGFNSVSNAFLDLPSVMTGLQDILYSTTLNSNQQNINYFVDAVKNYSSSIYQYHDSADTSYQKAKASYDKNFDDYKATSRYSDPATLESLINETYDTATNIAEAVKDTGNLIDFYVNQLSNNSRRAPAQVTTYSSSLNDYTSKANSHVSDLLSIQTSITSAKNSITNADASIQEKTQSLAKLQAGTDTLDLQSQQLSIQQRENALSDAQEKLADYTVRAPFNGILAAVNSKKGDSASSATIIASLVTKQQIAGISLNEVDAAKVKVGQKATLTFDALTNLQITGKVADIDSIGTVTSGVVTYNVKIALDDQNDQIKQGMSVSAAIITDAKSDVLMVPNSAVKTSGTQSYVQILNLPQGSSASNSQGVASATPPTNQAVTVGASNDSMTEITNGLNAGDEVVTRTISSTTTQTTTTSNSTGIPGLSGGNRGGAGIQVQGGGFRGD